MEGQGSKGDAIDTEKMENPDDSSGYQKMDQNKRQTLFASAAFILYGQIMHATGAAEPQSRGYMERETVIKKGT